MVNLINLLATQPTGFWPSIIQFFNSAFVNYAVAIIMLTLCIKLIMLPFDYLNKRVARKNQQIQTVIQPELVALQKKYGNNRDVLNQKTQELYKRHNVNMGGSCLIMLINLVFTFVVFLTLFSGLNTMASYKLESKYEQLEQTYISVVYTGDYSALTDDEITSYINQVELESKVEQANTLVAEKYNEIKDSWLWINNIWMADSPFEKQIPTFDEYVTSARITFQDLKDNDGTIIKNATTLREEAKQRYETVMNPLSEVNKGVNGYLILTILTVVSALLMQIGNQKGWFRKKSIRQKMKEQRDLQKRQQQLGQAPQTSSMNAMMIIMPLLMGYFTLMYNSVFSLYIVIGQLFGFVTSPLIDLILDIKDEKAMAKQNISKGRIVR